MRTRIAILKVVRDDERGIALVTAIMVMMAVGLLAAVAVQIGTHNLDQSSLNRRRVQAGAAAEAGINHLYSFLQTATPGWLVPDYSSPDPCEVSGTTSGGSTWTATVTYYREYPPPTPDEPDEPGTMTIECDDTSGQVPRSVLIRSVGSGSGSVPQRQLESLVKLTEVRGALGASAVFSEQDVKFQSNTSLAGGTALNADVYTNKNFIGDTHMKIQGSVFAQGSISFKGSGGGAEVARNAWSRLGMTFDNGFPVRGNATSSQQSISGNGYVDGDAQACVTVALTGVKGLSITGKCVGPPPLRSFPPYAYDPDDWVEAGYTNIRSYTGPTACSDARQYLTGTGSGSYMAPGDPPGATVVRVAEKCRLNIPKSGSSTEWSVIVRSNLAVLTDGTIELASNGGIGRCGVAGAGSLPCPSEAPSTFNVFMFAAANEMPPHSGVFPSADCDDSQDKRGDFIMRSNSNFSSGLRAVIRTPCKADFSSNGNILDGQIFANSTSFSSNTTLTYYTVEVPGSAITGFREDIIYTREVPVG